MLEPRPEPAVPTAVDFATALEQLTTGRVPTKVEVLALAKTSIDMVADAVTLREGNQGL